MTFVDLSLVRALPPELRDKIFSYLPPDLQTLLLRGRIVVTYSRTVSLLSSMEIRVFLVGGGGRGYKVC